MTRLREKRSALEPPISLWVVPVSDMAGVGRHVTDVARHGLPGMRLVVLCPPGPLVVALRDVGAAVVVAEFGPQAGLIRSISALHKTVACLQPAVVHTHLAYADVVAAVVISAHRQVQLISTEHGIAADDLVYHGSRWRSELMRLVHKSRLKRCNALIAVSEATREVMENKWGSGREIHVIRNAVEPWPAHHKSRGEGLKVLSLSRLAPEKRIDALIRAMPLILAHTPSATLTVAGQGEQLSSLRALASSLGVGDAVDFAGFVDAHAAIRTHDVVVQLSVWENLSYTLLDARAAGIAVVATDVGGNREILPPQALITDLCADSVAQAVLKAVEENTTQDTANECSGGVGQMAAAIARLSLATVEKSQRVAA